MDEVEHRRIYTWTCPICDKFIQSLYYKQFLELKAIHMVKHDLEKVKEEEKKHGKAGKHKKSA
jgi:hypothetical protein